MLTITKICGEYASMGMLHKWTITRDGDDYILEVSDQSSAYYNGEAFESLPAAINAMEFYLHNADKEGN